MKTIAKIALAALALALPAYVEAAPMRVAFVGDQGVSTRAENALKLVKGEGARLVVHTGDMGYKSPPAEFERMLTRVLGANFPVIPTIGNHDVEDWDGPGGYRDLFERRLMRAGIQWEGALGERGAVKLSGLSVFIAAPGIFRDNRKGTDSYAAYLDERLAKDSSAWKICLWHKNQERMTVGDKRDETGWAVYEACRKHGAMIVTGHAHVYARTHLLSDMARQAVATTSSEMPLGAGTTIAVVSGLGGNHRDPIRKERLGPWWAKTYADEYGALFCDFDPEKTPASVPCYFKDIKGKVIDKFTLKSVSHAK